MTALMAECVAACKGLKVELGRVPTREECTALVTVIYARHGLDANGEPVATIPETPDEQRDREENEEVRWAREHDSHDSSRILK